MPLAAQRRGRRHKAAYTGEFQGTAPRFPRSGAPRSAARFRRPPAERGLRATATVGTSPAAEPGHRERMFKYEAASGSRTRGEHGTARVSKSTGSTKPRRDSGQATRTPCTSLSPTFPLPSLQSREVQPRVGPSLSPRPGDLEEPLRVASSLSFPIGPYVPPLSPWTDLASL